MKGGALRPDTEVRSRELDTIHKLLARVCHDPIFLWVQYLLAQFEVPAWVAWLPTLVGIPAGGSLTGDEYKMLITVFGVPVVSTNPICFH